MIRKSIDKILGWALVIFMGVLVLDVLWQVFSRYVLGSPSSYTDELAGYLLIWVGLLGAAYVCGQREHLAIDILVQKMKGKVRLQLEIFIYAVTILFAVAVMVVGGVWLVYTRFILEVTSASLEINLGFVYMALPLSGILIVYYSLDNALRTIQGYKKGTSDEVFVTNN